LKVEDMECKLVAPTRMIGAECPSFSIAAFISSTAIYLGLIYVHATLPATLFFSLPTAELE
jgi:hypothetical protein